ncbi:MAG TPA: ATP-binding protein [Opitutaceae bacterium]|nr:ATP-binding protein [Opitutaceae bacterium]
MSHHRSRRLKVAAAWLAIFITGLVVAWFVQRFRRADLIARLLDDAKRAAIVFGPGQMERLAGARPDTELPIYATVKQRLRRLRQVHPRNRDVSLVRFLPGTGRVIVLANSAAPDAKNEAMPGDEYARADGRPGLERVIRTGEAAIDGPITDDAGTWITAYAVVGERIPEGEKMAIKEIVGIDVSAAHWNRELWQAGFQGAFFTWIVLGLPLLALLVRRRQDEQREVIRNLSEAMEQSHSAILIVDLQSRIEYANRGLCEQIGYARRDLIGRPWRDFQVAQTPDHEMADLIATVRAGRRWDGEWLNLRKDGSIYPVRGMVTPVKHRDGSLACFVAVFDDVTEVKRREAELREARDLAEAGDRAKGQFLATMSHEVRTPLNGIVGFTSLLLDTGLSQEQREYVQTIRISTEALIQLTGDILDFARIESGKLKLEPLACDPLESVEEALDLLAAKAAEKKIELLHRAADDMPSAVVTDGGRLRQVLVNLVGNAIKFTDRGEVEVSLTVARDGSDGRPLEPRGPTTGSAAQPEMCTLTFAVRDTGIGIAPENQPRLFKPFSQLDDSTTRRYGGTGLGLAISRNLVHMLGGEIGVVSALGKGSTFSFTIRAPMAAPLPPVRDLGGLRVGLCMRTGALRSELARSLQRWKGQALETSSMAELATLHWDTALVDVDLDSAHALAARLEPRAEFPPGRTLALIPITLPNELRAGLRTHFKLLLNKPVHYNALYSLLSGTRADVSAAVPAPTHFGFRVLIVEDNVINQRLMQRVLTTLGCASTVVENGRRAVEELSTRAAEYDLVVLDLHMPEMDGLTALQEIRVGQAGPRAQTMWIIALTADAREEQRMRGLSAGLNDYLTKPVKLVEIDAALRKFRYDRTVRRR